MHVRADKLPPLFMESKTGKLVKLDADGFKSLLSKVLILDAPKPSKKVEEMKDFVFTLPDTSCVTSFFPSPKKKERGFGSMLSREEKLIAARLKAQGEL